MNSTSGFDSRTQLLIQRGFSREEIEDGFADYISGKKEWMIQTITPGEVAETKGINELRSKLFAKDSMGYWFACPNPDQPFSCFAGAHPFFDIPAGELDPYIARLVRALNACGVWTTMSCDGWHSEKENELGYRRYMQLWMMGRYSTLWMWMIVEFVFGEKWDHSKHHDYSTYGIYRREELMGDWKDQWEPSEKSAWDYTNPGSSLMVYQISRGHEQEAYKKADRYAAFLEQNSGKLMQIRAKWIEGVRGEKSDDEIEMLGFLELRRLALKYCEAELVNCGSIYFYPDLSMVTFYHGKPGFP